MTITYEEFSKIELKVATILEATEIAGAKKLLQLKISLGSEERIIVAGIKLHYQPEAIIGKQIIVVANLEPRVMKISGQEITSHGMLLAASDENGVFLIAPDKSCASGSSVG